MNEHPNDEFDELMRRALHSEADRIEPADGLHEIQARVRSQRAPVNRRGWVLTAGAAAVGTAAAIGAFALLNGEDRPSGDSQVAGAPETSATATGSVDSTLPPSAVPTPAPRPTEPTPKALPTQSGKLEPKGSGAIPVYWLGRTDGIETGAGVRLYRTFAQFEGRPTYSALQLMVAGKSSDPDYISPWSGAQVAGVRMSGALTTVDFAKLPTERLDQGVAQMALQQLVYTVQGASGQTVPIEVTLRGKPVSHLFGVEIKQPLGRAQSLDVQALIWITAPENGAVVRSPLKVSGVAAAHEAQLNWRITSDDTKRVIDEGVATTEEAYKFTPYSFVVAKLPAGRYTLEVFEVSVADGRQTSTDTKSILVK
ncbi:hypothetical protein BWI15_05090 [Kribbella sp. ALI-6-A]|uniref:Gmad2 immunoglobulin-like domain-containing protein n=1 Tax=Kribbella sp. ALI-6-A TaxID=1933817 RepID=UPI00097CA639|nr:Gmad2 immunoglobulin-like domain-containing protein [Kribbella sp. ALI-6-A]ONI76673.1 hypothetical protein BWI15_05090 [Kribbella sp. ALI-6-A]